MRLNGGGGEMVFYSDEAKFAELLHFTILWYPTLRFEKVQLFVDGRRENPLLELCVLDWSY